jgi:hypothetical protein
MFLAPRLALPTPWLLALAGGAALLAGVETFQLGARVRGVAPKTDALPEPLADERTTPGGEPRDRSRSP